MTHQGSQAPGGAYTLLVKRPETISAVVYEGASRPTARPTAFAAAGAGRGGIPGVA